MFYNLKKSLVLHLDIAQNVDKVWHNVRDKEATRFFKF